MESQSKFSFSLFEKLEGRVPLLLLIFLLSHILFVLRFSENSETEIIKSVHAVNSKKSECRGAGNYRNQTNFKEIEYSDVYHTTGQTTPKAVVKGWILT